MNSPFLLINRFQYINNSVASDRQKKELYALRRIREKGKIELTEGTSNSRWFVEALAGVVSAGGFFIIIGIVYTANQNLWHNIVKFGNDFTNVTVPHTNIILPAPLTPAAHTAVYSAAYQFALAIGILQIMVLIIRLAFNSRVRQTAETVGSLIFWFATAYALYGLAGMSIALSQSQQLTLWFQFWAVIIMLIGISLIVRGAVIATARLFAKKDK
jgi:hypothetical protein